MTQPVVVFLHGLESGPAGFKIRELSRVVEAHGGRVLAPDCQGVRDPQVRVSTVWAQWPHQAATVILVGSSLGGYVAAALAAQHRPANLQHLLLLCPALICRAIHSIGRHKPCLARPLLLCMGYKIRWCLWRIRGTRRKLGKPNCW